MPEAELDFYSLSQLPLVNTHLHSIKIHLKSRINLDWIVEKVPAIRSLTITGFQYRHTLDFSFLRACPNLETFHLSRVSSSAQLTESNVAKLSYLKFLIEMDLHDCEMAPNAMLTLLKALPLTLRRFRHRTGAALRHFAFVVERFPTLEEFTIVGTMKNQPQVCSVFSVVSFFCTSVQPLFSPFVFREVVLSETNGNSTLEVLA